MRSCLRVCLPAPSISFLISNLPNLSSMSERLCCLLPGITDGATGSTKSPSWGVLLLSEPPPLLNKILIYWRYFGCLVFKIVQYKQGIEHIIVTNCTDLLKKYSTASINYICRHNNGLLIIFSSPFPQKCPLLLSMMNSIKLIFHTCNAYSPQSITKKFHQDRYF